MNRLNDWFSDLYQNRTSSNSPTSSSAPTTSAQQQVSTITSVNQALSAQTLQDSSDNEFNDQAQIYQRNENNSNNLPEFKTLR